MRKFTFWCAEVATTIINTSQPPPPVSTRGPPQVYHKADTSARINFGTIHVVTRVDTRRTLW